VSDVEAARLLSGCRALVVTGPEEFGIAAVEAQAAGRPVIARAAGGLLENVVDEVTGCLWNGGPPQLADAVSGFDTAAVDPEACIDNAKRFDSAVFRESFPREVEEALRDGPVERLETWPRIPRRPALPRRPAWRPGRSGPA
jgi:glycosyltransferase involved in cell wall biosynthesis